MANAAFGTETQPTTMPNAGPGYEAKYAYSETLTGPEYHCHDFYEFYIHIRGGQRYGMYERLFQLRPNQLFIIPPFVMHGLSYDDVLRGYERAYVNVTTEMVNRLGFGKFDLDGFFRSYTSKGNYAFQLSALDAEACVSYVKRIQESTPSDDPADGFAGCCALAGTTYDTDRVLEAELLGFDGICPNSMDGVSDRDFAVELLSALSILMMHLSRLSEELILWASWEFRFISLSDAYTTGSSIMPQKRNADMAELVRGKTGRVYGDLMGLLTVLKGLPLAYNKDMQEDKEGVFDACDTVKMCLKVLTPMLQTMQVNTENMLRAAQGGFINATDLADYLVKKGMPFRSAYKISGQLVALCMREGCVLETLPLSRYREFSDLFDEDLYAAIDLKTCMEKRGSEGGTSVASVEKQIAAARKILTGKPETGRAVI